MALLLPKVCISYTYINLALTLSDITTAIPTSTTTTTSSTSSIFITTTTTHPATDFATKRAELAFVFGVVLRGVDGDASHRSHRRVTDVA